MCDTNRFQWDSKNIIRLERELREFNPWAEILVGYMKEKNIQQNQLAAQTYVTNPAVHKWYHGKCLPDIVMVRNISKALSLSEDQTGVFIEIWRITSDVQGLAPLLDVAETQEDFNMVERTYVKWTSHLITLINFFLV